MRHIILASISLLLLLAPGKALKAQLIPCVDSLRINPFFPCPTPDFFPVCGCDNKTYRSACDAFQRNGINQYIDGVCDAFDFDFYPNPAFSILNFTLVFRSEGAGDISIVDTFGNLVYFRNVFTTPRERIDIDVTNLLDGLYFIIVRANGIQKTKRFVKMNF